MVIGIFIIVIPFECKTSILPINTNEHFNHAMLVKAK